MKYTEEIKSFLNSLIAANFTLHSVDNGEGRVLVKNNIEKALSEIDATDESYLFVSHSNYDKRRATIFIVLGNNAGEMVNDYSIWPELEVVCDAHFTKYNPQS